MKTPIPNSLFGRVALVLLAGLTAAQIVGLVIREEGGGKAISFLEGYEIVERIAATTRLIEATPPDRRREILRLVDRESLHMSWDDRSVVAPGIERDSALDIIRGIFELRTADFGPRQIRVAYAQSPLHSTGILPPAGRIVGAASNDVRGRFDAIMTDIATGRDFVISVELSDGTWLNFAAPYIRSLSLLSWDVIASLALTALVVLALSMWAVRRVTRPLETFTAAVERLSVDVHAPPLAETGPREVRRAIVAFNTMQRRIRRYVDDRIQTVAAISHDLRTPITRLRLRAETVDDPKTRRAIVANLEEMEKMIFATLNMGRQEADVESRAVVDLAEMLRKIAAETPPKGAVRVTGAKHLPYLCRPVAIGRCIGNLIDNAIKYGRRARVDLSEADGRVRIAVEDSGPGIPEAERETVFRPFYRLDGAGKGPEAGVGMGLAVARTIARAHGGDVSLRGREEGSGLVAELNLPASHPSSPSTASESSLLVPSPPS